MQKQKLLPLFALMILCSFTATMHFPAALAAGGTTGALEVGTDYSTESGRLVIKCTTLEESADYSIEVDDVAVFNWTCSSSETSRYVYLTIPAGGADGAVKIELVNANVTVLDTVYLQVDSLEDQVPSDIVEDYFVIMIVLFIFAGILIGIGGAFLYKRFR